MRVVSGHNLMLRILEDGLITGQVACNEPEDSPCRLICANRCERIQVCEGGCMDYLEGDCPNGVHCAFCRAEMLPHGCHIAEWISAQGIGDSYGAEAPRTFLLKDIQVDWREEECTFSLPTPVLVSEVKE